MKLKQYKTKFPSTKKNENPYFIPQFLEKYDITEQLGKVQNKTKNILNYLLECIRAAKAKYIKYLIKKQKSLA